MNELMYFSPNTIIKRSSNDNREGVSREGEGLPVIPALFPATVKQMVDTSIGRNM